MEFNEDSFTGQIILAICAVLAGAIFIMAKLQILDCIKL